MVYRTRATHINRYLNACLMYFVSYLVSSTVLTLKWKVTSLYFILVSHSQIATYSKRYNKVLNREIFCLVDFCSECKYTRIKLFQLQFKIVHKSHAFVPEFITRFPLFSDKRTINKNNYFHAFLSSE